ncbi:hypothetical protein E2C01_093191 [Portunus trituberculatus]|uniref:Uncharacterized protein n=1 Tax=Portunus trituberculatus TaxID=210409 RepID=A0A5B7JZV9_PORTR|nr:hypothetical protein [Portunus trituberculatus]
MEKESKLKKVVNITKLHYTSSLTNPRQIIRDERIPKTRHHTSLHERRERKVGGRGGIRSKPSPSAAVT